MRIPETRNSRHTTITMTQGLMTSAIARFEAEAQARRTLAVYRELVAG